jgi:hypothetical protein
MKLLKVFFLAACVLVAGNVYARYAGIPQDCDKIETETKLESTADGFHKATIKIVKGNTSSAKYIFCDATGKVLNEGKFNDGSIGRLREGSYFCIVTTPECSKKISFTIE